MVENVTQMICSSVLIGGAFCAVLSLGPALRASLASRVLVPVRHRQPKGATPGAGGR